MLLPMRNRKITAATLNQMRAFLAPCRPMTLSESMRRRSIVSPCSMPYAQFRVPRPLCTMPLAKSAPTSESTTANQKYMAGCVVISVRGTATSVGAAPARTPKIVAQRSWRWPSALYVRSSFSLHSGRTARSSASSAQSLDLTYRCMPSATAISNDRTQPGETPGRRLHP